MSAAATARAPAPVRSDPADASSRPDPGPRAAAGTPHRPAGAEAGRGRTPGPVRPRLRALFVSDLHLGYKGADIRALNGLLAACEVEHLYLVGDVLDGWKLEKRWYWTQDYCDLLDLLMTLRRRRVRISLLTGNHDEKLREILPRLLRPMILRRFGIRIEERCVHRTAAGARLLVTHGDVFDGVLFRNTSKLADRFWLWLTERGLARPPRPGRRWSLGRAIAREGGALAESYAAAALRQATRDDVDGIVFGHSHVPLLQTRAGRVLANCGAWTRPRDGMHTAIAELPDGRLELLHWPAAMPAGAPQRAAPAASAAALPPAAASADAAPADMAATGPADSAVPAPCAPVAAARAAGHRAGVASGAATRSAAVPRPTGEARAAAPSATPAAPVPAGMPLRVQFPDSARLIRFIHALWRPTEPGALRLLQPAAPGASGLPVLRFAGPVRNTPPGTPPAGVAVALPLPAAGAAGGLPT